MRIAIFGTGGIGGYFGGRLAAAGQDVHFIARGAHLAALKRDGLQVESILGDFVVTPANATDDPASIGPVDTVLVAVKAWQVQEAAKALRPLLGESTAVLPLQNGVEAPAELAREVGIQRILVGLCKIISEISGPGRIRHFGAQPYIALGEVSGGSSPRVEALRQAFTDAGVTVEVPENIDAALWAKFLLIAAISGVGAVTRAPIGTLRTLPQTREMLRAAMEETAAVAAGLGTLLPGDIVDKTLAFVDSLPADGTASMQRDLMEGRPSELEYQNGSVVRLGERAGVPTPVHQFLYASLLPMELRAREIPKPAT